MTTNPRGDPDEGVDCPGCGEPTGFRRLSAENAHHVCTDCSTSGLLRRLLRTVAVWGDA